ncbi:MAG: phosphoglycerate dehydrogenase [Vulcanimicrobiota bacterium]
MARILVSDSLAEEALEALRKSAEVDVKTGLSPQELVSIIGDYDALLIRSATQVTAEVIEAGKNLQVIGRAGVGVDNVDVKAATARGILVINSPEGNTISAAEHTMALLLAAARRLPWAHASMERGEWDRKTFTGHELYNKTLGVVGFGRIGREVASRAASFKMKVLAHDPFVSDEMIASTGATSAEIDQLVAQADFITVHVPKVPETENLFNAERLAKMKKGAFLINCARGGIVDEAALVEVVNSGQLGGAALDVFESEPPAKDSPVRSTDRLVTTPHLAASTEEAQLRVATDVAEQVVEVLAGGPPRSAVNISYVPPKVLAFLKPYLNLAEKMGVFLACTAGGKLRRVQVVYRGRLADSQVSFLTTAALKGILAAGSPETVNFVNAKLVAQERGVDVTESKGGALSAYSSVIEMTVETDRAKRCCVGAVFEDDQPRVVSIDGLRLSVILEGHKLITWQNDQPGVIGRVGTVLGREDINVAEMQVGRAEARTRAVMVMSVDEKPTAAVLEEVRRLEGIEDAKLVTL